MFSALIVFVYLILEFESFTINFNRFENKNVYTSLVHSNLVLKSYHIGNEVEVIASDPKNSKQRLDSYLVSLYPEYSRSYLSDLCDNELVLVNNKPQDKSYKLKLNDKVNIKFKEKELPSIEPEDIKLGKQLFLFRLENIFYM